MPDCIYEGIDLANGIENLGRYFLRDDGQTLRLFSQAPETESIAKSAIDCPFGTTRGFASLLVGEWPDQAPVDGFKSRQTEVRLREVTNQYQIVQRWRNRTAEERQLYPREAFYNGGGHIQPTLAMRIVPECLWYLVNRYGKGIEASERRRRLVEARQGTGLWIEAHPRMFLYSALERLYRNRSEAASLAVLFTAARYKDSPANRQALYKLLREEKSWMGPAIRELHPVSIPDEMGENDHMFDGFLCALTAWAHSQGECVTWQEMGISAADVEVEGHILVLRQAGGH
jgi:hypothetical protein